MGDGDGAGESMTEVGDEVVGWFTGAFVGFAVKKGDGVGIMITTGDGSKVSVVGLGVLGWPTGGIVGLESVGTAVKKGDGVGIRAGDGSNVKVGKGVTGG